MSAITQLTKARPRIQYQFWAAPGQPGQTLDELCDKLEALGNEVLGVDEENQRVLVGQRSGVEDRWGCLLCLPTGTVTICDTQDELGMHLNNVHPGWRVNEKGEPVV